MPILNITQLEYIKAVAELRGIRKAASRLHVTPQAISSSIHRLESELGVRLLERHKNELEPTAFGLRFANRVGPILMALQDLERMAKKETGGVGEEGHFLLYVPGLNGRGDLFDDDMYYGFIEANPNIHLDVWVQSSESCEAALIYGVADAAVSFSRDRGDSLEYRELGRLPLVLLCASRSVLAANNIAQFADLTKHLLAMPVNLAACLNALSGKHPINLKEFQFRNTGYGMDEQREFIRRCGIMLALANAPLALADPTIATLKFPDRDTPYLPLYYCSRKGEWGERHQLMYWFILDSLSKILK